VEHGISGEQTGADPSMVARALEIPGFEEVELTMKAGDICWFHSNLMHCSAPNRSEAWRRNLICVYNSRHNEPDPAMAAVSGQPMYSPIAVVDEGAILEAGYKGLDRDLNDFLDQEAASTSIQEELGKKLRGGDT
jgi:ectoine hydroxylase